MNRQVRLVAAGFVLVLGVSGCGIADRFEAMGEPRTRVQLVATPRDGVPVTPEGMDDAVEVIRERLEADDRRLVDVVVDDATIALELTGELTEETRALITEPGALAFRPVLVLGAPGPGGGSESHDRTGVEPDVWSQFEALDCAAPQNPTGGGEPDLPLVACDQEGTAKYVLGPVEVDGTELTEVAAGALAGAPDDWGVSLELDDRGTRAFQQTTERLQALTQPRNQVAITLDGLVVSAPSIPQGVAITTGQMQIAGSFSQETAATLARQLSSDPLPFPFEVRDVVESG